MLKKMIVLSLMMTSLNAAAELTLKQTHSFLGTAGNSSKQEGIDPFMFSKFDSSLGTLTGVSVNYGLQINNGLIGADNLTNTPTNGTGELGGGVLFSSDLPFTTASFQPVFSQLELTQFTNFTLAADPSQTVGGDGDDIQTFTGSSFSDTTGNISLSDMVLSAFVGNGGDTFLVDFNTSSTVIVEVPGAQGFFQAVDSFINLDITYSYDPLPEPEEPIGGDAEINDVGEPWSMAIFGFGLMLAGRFKMRK